MLGFNGGLIGTPRTATSIEAPGIWSLNESNLFIGQGLWPPTAGEDLYFANVSLLLRGDGTNGSTTIIDGSSSPKTVTAFGNAQISTAQSKFGGASMLFDGNGGYLSIPNTEESDLYAGDFTIEFWIRINNTTGLRTIFATGWPIAIYVSSGSILVVVKNNVNASDPNLISGLSGTGVLSTTEWTHIALTRTAVGSSNTFKIFKNGTEVASQTATGSIARSNAPYFGIGNSPIFDSYFNGYIDDLRITKGIARYTTTFTPPGAL
jgi:hypothetical protein